MASKDAETPVSLRLPKSLLRRADALSRLMGKDDAVAALAGTNPSRSSVLRLALHHGLEVLEERYKAHPKGRKGQRD